MLGPLLPEEVPHLGGHCLALGSGPSRLWQQLAVAAGDVSGGRLVAHAHAHAALPGCEGEDRKQINLHGLRRCQRLHLVSRCRINLKQLLPVFAADVM